MQTLTHFSGPWQETDRAAVVAALEAFDTAPLDTLRHTHRWTCNLYPSEHGAVFTAARHGMSRVLTARSADELAERLRACLAPPLAA